MRESHYSYLLRKLLADPYTAYSIVRKCAGNNCYILLYLFSSLNQGRPQNFFQGGSKVISAVQGESKSENFAV